MEQYFYAKCLRQQKIPYNKSFKCFRRRCVVCDKTLDKNLECLMAQFFQLTFENYDNVLGDRTISETTPEVYNKCTKNVGVARYSELNELRNRLGKIKKWDESLNSITCIERIN